MTAEKWIPVIDPERRTGSCRHQAIRMVWICLKADRAIGLWREAAP